jgi:hypothetical protein
MIGALDSAYPPNDAQIAAAKAAGYAAWFGYFKFGNDGILNGWADADFQRVLAGGLETSAYWSGYADPLQVKARAAALGIRTRLDVEGGLRPNGDWVQGALDAAGSGLYGNGPVFPVRTALDYIIADYPGYDPGATWPSGLPRPNGPCGWQWQGSHAFAGISVDSNWLDDNFFAFGPGGGTIGGDEMKTYIVNTPTEGQWLLCLPSGYYVHLTTPAAVAQFSNDGATILAVDEQQHQNLLASRPSSGSGGTPPPPGPAEPTTLTLDVPAQTITGQLK